MSVRLSTGTRTQSADSCSTVSSSLSKCAPTVLRVYFTLVIYFVHVVGLLAIPMPPCRSHLYLSRRFVVCKLLVGNRSGVSFTELH